jgi:hypothetical protein
MADQQKPKDDPQPDADNQGVSTPEPAEGADDKPSQEEGSPE